ncbi:hypothetical protein [Streptomyces sp. or3]|nr:hypothetical protein [Streptomyces sp. or3]
MDTRTLSLLMAGVLVVYISYAHPAAGIAVAVGTGVVALLKGMSEE